MSKIGQKKRRRKAMISNQVVAVRPKRSLSEEQHQAIRDRRTDLANAQAALRDLFEIRRFKGFGRAREQAPQWIREAIKYRSASIRRLKNELTS